MRDPRNAAAPVAGRGETGDQLSGGSESILARATDIDSDGAPLTLDPNWQPCPADPAKWFPLLIDELMRLYASQEMRKCPHFDVHRPHLIWMSLGVGTAPDCGCEHHAEEDWRCFACRDFGDDDGLWVHYLDDDDQGRTYFNLCGDCHSAEVP